MSEINKDFDPIFAKLIKNAADNSTEGITISNITLPDEPLIYVNEGFVKLTGYTKEETIGKNCRFLQGEGTDPQSVQKLRKAIQEKKKCTVRILNYHKDGTPFWNRLSISPLINDRQEVTHYVGIQSDITELTETKEVLELANWDLRMFSNKINAELEQAKIAQQVILPVSFPESNKVKFVSKFIPMEKIGGDFFDVFESSKGVFGMMIADVTGHGISAALHTFMSSTVFKNASRGETSSAKIMNLTNKRLFQKMYEDTFLTMFLILYNTENDTITFTQAGHPPGLLLRKSTREIIPLRTMDPIVGVLSDDEVRFSQETLKVIKGDKILLYTDALLEIKNNSNEVIDDKRFQEFLNQQWDADIEDLIEECYIFGLDFSRKLWYDDDFTMVGLEIIA
jgi:PAS domain S-box-containing protein